MSKQKRRRGGRKTANQRRHKRSRQQAQRERAHGLRPDADDSGEHVIFLEEWESLDLFSKEKGRTHQSDSSDKIGDGAIVRLNGKKPPRARIPSMLGMERDKASVLMQNAKDASSARERRVRKRIERESIREDRLYHAHNKRTFAPVRMDGDYEGLPMFSVIGGTSKADGDPMTQWEDMIATWGGVEGVFHAGTVKWKGAMAEPDEHGDCHRCGFVAEPFEYGEDHPDKGELYTFVSEKHAHRTIRLMLMEGQFEGYTRKEPKFRERMAKRLNEWQTREEPFAKDEDGRARLRGARLEPGQEGPQMALEAEDWDFQYKADIGAEQSLRNEPGFDMLTEIQLEQNRAHDSE